MLYLVGIILIVIVFFIFNSWKISARSKLNDLADRVSSNASNILNQRRNQLERVEVGRNWCIFCFENSPSYYRVSYDTLYTNARSVSVSDIIDSRLKWKLVTLGNMLIEKLNLTGYSVQTTKSSVSWVDTSKTVTSFENGKVVSEHPRANDEILEVYLVPSSNISQEKTNAEKARTHISI